eukprot:4985638-Pyramimonas_sp.AAC.1
MSASRARQTDRAARPRPPKFPIYKERRVEFEHSDPDICSSKTASSAGGGESGAKPLRQPRSRASSL